MDPDVIFDVDIFNPEGECVECSWGYRGCTRKGMAADMVPHDGDWMCPSCYRTAEAEAEDYDLMRAGY